MSVFLAFPSKPGAIKEDYDAALNHLRAAGRTERIFPWTDLDLGGRTLWQAVAAGIQSHPAFAADITILNQNVVYEIGYAIGLRKPIFLFLNTKLSSESDLRSKLGLFDIIGFKSYYDSNTLANALRETRRKIDPFFLNETINKRAPVYLLDSSQKEGLVAHIKSRVKKHLTFFRSFDPHETVRLPFETALSEVGSSVGVIVSFVPAHHGDSAIHNLRSAFVAGLAQGMQKQLLSINIGDTPAPLDFRDHVHSCYSEEQIDRTIDKFSLTLLPLIQEASATSQQDGLSFLESLDVGSSVAENERHALTDYYLRVDAFMRADRGEIRVVRGRKGSGKTALFTYLREKKRATRKNIVVDLKPEGYKFIKFREEVLELVKQGSREHLLTVLWDYILLLELTYKILEDDRRIWRQDHTISEHYSRLRDAYNQSDFHSAGDFSERLGHLLNDISQKLKARAESGEDIIKIDNPQMTSLVYKHSVVELKEALAQYLQHKDEVWILVDNLDKGWPSAGITDTDTTIVRCLIEGAEKLRRQVSNRWEVPCFPVVFLRNDVFEHLIDRSSDRGKYSSVSVDWTDSKQLKEMLRRRFSCSSLDKSLTFDEMWSRIATKYVGDEISSDFLVQHCLMRPRSLLDLFITCKGFAVNRHHKIIEEDDFLEGVKAYSIDLVENISLEIRDVAHGIDNLLYVFIGRPHRIDWHLVKENFRANGIEEERHEEIRDLLFWYGVLGIETSEKKIIYIYDVNYNFRMMDTIYKQHYSTCKLHINPAFRPALGVTEILESPEPSLS